MNVERARDGELARAPKGAFTMVRPGDIPTTRVPSRQPATTIRLTDEDRAILGKLRKMTGLDSSTAIIRLAIREALAVRVSKRR